MSLRNGTTTPRDRFYAACQIPRGFVPSLDVPDFQDHGVRSLPLLVILALWYLAEYVVARAYAESPITRAVTEIVLALVAIVWIGWVFLR